MCVYEHKYKVTCFSNDLYQLLYLIDRYGVITNVGCCSMRAHHFAGGTTHWRWKRGVVRGRGTHTCGEIIIVTAFLFLAYHTVMLIGKVNGHDITRNPQNILHAADAPSTFYSSACMCTLHTQFRSQLPVPPLLVQLPT